MSDLWTENSVKAAEELDGHGHPHAHSHPLTSNQTYGSADVNNRSGQLSGDATLRNAKRQRRPLGKRSGRLHLAIHVNAPPDESYDADDQVFVRGNLAIDSTGVAIRDQPLCFTIAYDELELGEIIGKGSTSMVIKARHTPTGQVLALKVISMFEKSKREQLMMEITTLYNASCPSLITFYGAYYREGVISIALEYMDGGSLSNAMSQIGPIPEAALANMAFQVLWALAYLKREQRVHRDIQPSNLLVNSRGEVKVPEFWSVCCAETLPCPGVALLWAHFKYMSPRNVFKTQPYRFRLLICGSLKFGFS
eukprot:FR742734.1.p1 GENE.FR742734.1~~FR742734.1.p1  ORF type:complete len:329 (+),score=29.23 FR742734.1:62-988(+)